MKKRNQMAVARYVESIIKEIENIPQTMESLYLFLKAHYSQEICAYFFDEDGKRKKQSYHELFRQAEYLGSHMNSIFSKIESTQPIALKYRNSPEWPALFFGILMSNHPVLLLDAKLPKENTNNLLKQANAGSIICNESETYLVPSYRLSDLKKSTPKEPVTWNDEIMFCSSGTTGTAKIMVFDGKAIFGQIISAKMVANETSDIIYEGSLRNFAMIPFHHIFGFVAVFLWYSTLGKTLVYPASNATKDLLYAIKKGKCDHIYSVPLLWDGIAQTVERTFSLKKPKIQNLFHKMISYNLGEISKKEAGIASFSFFQNIVRNQILGNKPVFCISGGGYLSKETLRLINGLGYPLYNGYGMTEIGVTSVELSPDVKTRLLGSIGKPFFGVNYQLHEGELEVQCRSMHIASIVNGVRESFPRDQYLKTGDIAEKIDDRWYIRGRKKDVIINNDGENIYPDEIEYYFKEISLIKNCVAFGVTEGHKEHIVLIIELTQSPRKEVLFKVKEELTNINNKLSSSKKVSEFAISSSSLPLANSMKIKRGEVKKLYLENPDSFLYFDKKRRINYEENISFDGYDHEEVNEILNEIRRAFSDNLSLPIDQISDDAIWDSDLGGDSMSYISMIADLDEHFQVDIPEDKYGKVGSVKGFTKLILELRHGKK